MPSPVYQNVVNLVELLSIRRCPSEFMNVTMWEHRIFYEEIFGRGTAWYGFMLWMEGSCEYNE
jgi:hypothetical protein